MAMALPINVVHYVLFMQYLKFVITLQLTLHDVVTLYLDLVDFMHFLPMQNLKQLKVEIVLSEYMTLNWCIIYPLLFSPSLFKVDKHENDGLVLLQRLATCSSDNDVISEMSKVKGPWSFVYWKVL